MNTTLSIDGSTLEGGGQSVLNTLLHRSGEYLETYMISTTSPVLRNAAAYAILFNIPIEITKIRQNRPKPGLRPQHLCGLELCAKLRCSSQASPDAGCLVGGNVGSQKITLLPNGELFAGLLSSESLNLNKDNTRTSLHSSIHKKTLSLSADCGTAGSISLMIQSILPILLCCNYVSSTSSASPTSFVDEIRLTLCGGTDVDMSPSLDFYRHVFFPFLERWFGQDTIRISQVRRGFYPKGGGVVVLRIKPLSASSISPLQLTTRGLIQSLHGIIFKTNNIPAHVPVRIMQSCDEVLRTSKELEPFLEHAVSEEVFDVQELQPASTSATFTQTESAVGEGVGVLLVAKTSSNCTLASSCLRAKNKPSEKLGTSTADSLLRAMASGGCVDEYLQDQIVIYMTLVTKFTGKECSVLVGPLTLHTKTAIWVAELCVTDVRWEVKEHGRCYLMRCFPSESENGTE